MGGRDPVIVRRLGQHEDETVVLNLGLNYHLDSYLDEDSKRFAAEFPQCFQVGGGVCVFWGGGGGVGSGVLPGVGRGGGVCFQVWGGGLGRGVVGADGGNGGGARGIPGRGLERFAAEFPQCFQVCVWGRGGAEGGREWLVWGANGGGQRMGEGCGVLVVTREGGKAGWRGVWGGG